MSGVLFFGKKVGSIDSMACVDLVWPSPERAKVKRLNEKHRDESEREQSRGDHEGDSRRRAGPRVQRTATCTQKVILCVFNGSVVSHSK